jgi:hypothetical protein
MEDRQKWPNKDDFNLGKMFNCDHKYDYILDVSPKGDMTKIYSSGVSEVIYYVGTNLNYVPLDVVFFDYKPIPQYELRFFIPAGNDAKEVKVRYENGFIIIEHNEDSLGKPIIAKECGFKMIKNESSRLASFFNRQIKIVGNKEIFGDHVLDLDRITATVRPNNVLVVFLPVMMGDKEKSTAKDIPIGNA